MSFYKNWITQSIPETCRRRPRHHGDLDTLNGEVGVESCGLVDPRVGAGCSRKTNELVALVVELPMLLLTGRAASSTAPG